MHQLNQSGRLTPTIILRAICMGDLDFFEHAVAELAGVPAKSASTLIHDDGPLGLRAIMSRASLPDAFYPAFHAAVEAAHETEYDGGENDRARYRRRMIERILTHVENPDSEMGKDNIEYLFEKLSQIEPGVLSIFPDEPEAEASSA